MQIPWYVGSTPARGFMEPTEIMTRDGKPAVCFEAGNTVEIDTNRRVVIIIIKQIKYIIPFENISYIKFESNKNP